MMWNWVRVDLAIVDVNVYSQRGLESGLYPGHVLTPHHSSDSPSVMLKLKVLTAREGPG